MMVDDSGSGLLMEKTPEQLAEEAYMRNLRSSARDLTKGAENNSTGDSNTLKAKRPRGGHS